MPPPPPQGPALHVENWSPCRAGRRPAQHQCPAGGAGRARIGEELVAGGRDPATPAAVIQQGTVRGQRLLLSRLWELAQRVEACAPEPADAELPIPF